MDVEPVPIHEQVSVILVRAKGTQPRPYSVKWRGRIYRLDQVTSWLPGKNGKRLLHTFTVQAGSLLLLLSLDSNTLVWTLEEVLLQQ